MRGMATPEDDAVDDVGGMVDGQVQPGEGEDREDAGDRPLRPVAGPARAPRASRRCPPGSAAKHGDRRRGHGEAAPPADDLDAVRPGPGHVVDERGADDGQDTT